MPAEADVTGALGRSRAGVVDLGSNSVRMVVFDGLSRDPVPIFNEKAILRLGRGLAETGRLDSDARDRAAMVLRRYHAIARAMGADPFQVLGTAAVREATDGPDFVDEVRAMLPGVSLQVLSGAEEAALSADGLLCGIPDADGVLADLGGGSLELARLRDGVAVATATLPLGAIRLAERARGDLLRARALAEEALAGVPWLAEAEGADLYAVGGAWRSLARAHMMQTGYPLPIVHHYIIGRDEARDLTGVVAGAGRRALERMPGLSRRRIDDAPFAAVVLRRVLRATAARRVVFSANGLREGWYARLLPETTRRSAPLIAAARMLGLRLGRDAGLPPALLAWTAPLLGDGTEPSARLREAACWLSDIGAAEHPEFRAEAAYHRVLRHPGTGFDHYARAFLALAVARRYDAAADAAFLGEARALLDPGSARSAEALGLGLRLAYTLCAGVPGLLAATAIGRRDGEIVLRLATNAGVFAGDSVARRLAALADALGLAPRVTMEADAP